ncbi:MAG: M15 family metallopeptidase [Defluviitaleaceae bacterium]|nr:M15 family metallopeptidase [Defluviitaleaceae bacterium]
MTKILFLLIAIFITVGYAQTTQIYVLVDGNRKNITVVNHNGFNYISAGNIHYLFAQTPHINIPQNIHGFVAVRDLSDIIEVRLNWVPTRNTLIIDTTPSYIPLQPVFTAEPLPYHIIELITDSSFHPHTRFGHYHLAYLTLTHIDFQGNRRLGQMIVAAQIAEEVLEIFQEIYEAQWPIERIRLIDFYDATDYYSMHDNNSVGFNYRNIAGTNTLSRHGMGMAIDINPVQNPYQRGQTIWPLIGADYLDRNNVRPGMITRGDAVYTAFISRGWIWGGNWTSPRDYHHFERR